ncbi:MAG TPA: FkbM family methyltransferase [Opitutaceae bacterium]|nr:FkbM family methyltransferase [Opitutaceae bacterium]
MITRLLSILQLAAETPASITAKLRGADARAYAFLRRPWIAQLGIQTVLDVGGNVGHWAKACRLAMPDVAICSFEPLPACQEALRKRMSGDARHQTLSMALGSRPGELTMHVHAHAASSSLLPETDTMRDLNRGRGTMGELPVPVETLDNMASVHKWSRPCLLKIDVQGYELEVLKGAAGMLPDTALIIAETSFRPLYQGQACFQQIHDYVSNSGFVYMGSSESVLKMGNGLEVQQDSLFINELFLPKVDR